MAPFATFSVVAWPGGSSAGTRAILGLLAAHGRFDDGQDLGLDLLGEMGPSGPDVLEVGGRPWGIRRKCIGSCIAGLSEIR